MGRSALVVNSEKTGRSSALQPAAEWDTLTRRNGEATPTLSKNGVSSCRMKNIPSLWERRGLSGHYVRFILESWAPSTRKQYNSALKSWETYCIFRGLNPIFRDYELLADFLSLLATEGRSYSSVASTRAAVCTFWEHLPGA